MFFFCQFWEHSGALQSQTHLPLFCQSTRSSMAGDHRPLPASAELQQCPAPVGLPAQVRLQLLVLSWLCVIFSRWDSLSILQINPLFSLWEPLIINQFLLRAVLFFSFLFWSRSWCSSWASAVSARQKNDYSACGCWGMFLAQVAKEQANEYVMWWMSMLIKDSSDSPWLLEACALLLVCVYLLHGALQRCWSITLEKESSFSPYLVRVPQLDQNEGSSSSVQ